MIAYGILALLGMGVAMSAGGGGDDADVEPIQDDEDTGLAPDLLDPVTPELDLDAEYEQRIDDFIAELIAEPNLSADEANARLEAFLAELEAERAGEQPIMDPPAEDAPTLEPPTVAPPVAEDPEAVQRPPLIDDERNPANRPQTGLPPADEPEPDTPPEPEPEPIPVGDLVTVTTNTGTEFLDSVVLSDGPTSGENADRDYIVAPTTVSNDIVIGYDPLTTFLVEYTDQTETITVSLNSDLDGPDGRMNTSSSQLTDANGTPYTATSVTQSYTDSAAIIMQVSADQIGTHVSQIDLTNPRDTLNFNFGADVTGDLHLVYNDTTLENGDDSATLRTLYVIETAANAGPLTDSGIRDALDQSDAATSEYRLLAEIYLGQDSVRVEGDPNTSDPYEIVTENSVNDNPRITTNVDWTSTTEFDGEVPATITLL